MDKKIFMSELSKLKISELIAKSCEEQELLQMEIAELKSKYSMELMQEKRKEREK